jgi:hypothetical protein
VGGRRRGNEAQRNDLADWNPGAARLGGGAYTVCYAMNELTHIYRTTTSANSLTLLPVLIALASGLKPLQNNYFINPVYLTYLSYINNLFIIIPLKNEF